MRKSASISSCSILLMVEGLDSVRHSSRRKKQGLTDLVLLKSVLKSHAYLKVSCTVNFLALPFGWVHCPWYHMPLIFILQLTCRLRWQKLSRLKLSWRGSWNWLKLINERLAFEDHYCTELLSNIFPPLFLFGVSWLFEDYLVFWWIEDYLFEALTFGK